MVLAVLRWFNFSLSTGPSVNFLCAHLDKLVKRGACTGGWTVSRIAGLAITSPKWWRLMEGEERRECWGW